MALHDADGHRSARSAMDEHRSLGDAWPVHHTLHHGFHLHYELLVHTAVAQSPVDMDRAGSERMPPWGGRWPVRPPASGRAGGASTGKRRHPAVEATQHVGRRARTHRTFRSAEPHMVYSRLRANLTVARQASLVAVGGFVRRGTHLNTVRQNRGSPAETSAAAAGAASTAGGDMTTGNPPVGEIVDEASPANGASPELHNITAGVDVPSTAASNGHPTADGVAANLENDNTAGRDAAQGGGVGASGTAIVTANTTDATRELRVWWDIKRDIYCAPKAAGGMGLISLEHQIEALRANLIARWLNTRGYLHLILPIVGPIRALLGDHARPRRLREAITGGVPGPTPTPCHIVGHAGPLDPPNSGVVHPQNQQTSHARAGSPPSTASADRREPSQPPATSNRRRRRQPGRRQCSRRQF
jgi:hypothetical protein